MASNDVYNVYKRNGVTYNINKSNIKSKLNSKGKNETKKSRVDSNLISACQTQEESNVLEDVILLSNDELSNTNGNINKSKYYTRRNLEYNAKINSKSINLEITQFNDNGNSQNAKCEFGTLETTSVGYKDDKYNIENSVVDVVVQNLLDVAINRNMSTNVESKCSLIGNRECQSKHKIECNYSNDESIIPTIENNLYIHQENKSELEQEMELYEAFERNEEVRLIHCNLHNQMEKDSIITKESQNKKKRALEGCFYECKKKRNKCEQKSIVKTKNEEDVCFICFDGGDLVLCDHRLCPKAYHLSCIGRDEAFFIKKGSWFCGSHFCLNCKKSGNYQCYTCPTSFCKQCIKKSKFCIQSKKKGLCEECLPIVSMIEYNKTINNEGEQVDFEDKETYECLFKEYWLELKNKYSILVSLLDNGGIELKNSSDCHSTIQNNSNGEGSDVESDKAFHSSCEAFEHSSKKVENNQNKDIEIKETSRTNVNEKFPNTKIIYKNIHLDKIHHPPSNDLNQEKTTCCKEDPSTIEEWASRELKTFLKYMKEDISKPLTRFAVHKLLWLYIKEHKLQNPKKIGDIICDKQLRLIFEKESIGQFEMFKLLNHHFLAKEHSNLSKKTMITTEKQKPEDISTLNVVSLDKSKCGVLKIIRKTQKFDESSQRPKSDEYVAINYKNISLIYLRRSILEEFIIDPNFESKVIGTFVKIRVPGNSKMDSCYRLVFVTGVGKQKESYLIGSSMTNVTLSILNLQKKESITIDVVSNQDFTEEECKRLRLNIKCGFLKTFTVGQLEEKAISLQEAKVNDWMETERQRLINLRDRASEKGRKKELRECVEKLQELNNPSFRVEKVKAKPTIFVDPHMDPNYESEDNSDEGEGNILSDKYCNSTKSYNQTLNSCLARQSWGGSCIGDSKLKYDSNNKVSSSSRDEEINKQFKDWKHIGATSYQPILRPAFALNCNAQNKEANSCWSDEKEKQSFYKKNDTNIDSQKKTKDRRDLSEKYNQRTVNFVGMKNEVISTSNYSKHYKSMPISLVPTISVNLNNSMEHEKLWHYVDPTGTIQGPFSIEQLRKWNGTGLFPIDLRIWKTTEEQNQSILLTDGLQGKFNIKHDHLYQVVKGQNEKCQAFVSTPLDSRQNERGIAQESDHVMVNVLGLENIKPNGLVQAICDMDVANHLEALSFDKRLEDVDNLQNIFLEVNTSEVYNIKDEGQPLKGQIDYETSCKFDMQEYCWKGKSCGY